MYYVIERSTSLVIKNDRYMQYYITDMQVGFWIIIEKGELRPWGSSSSVTQCLEYLCVWLKFLLG